MEKTPGRNGRAPAAREGGADARAERLAAALRANIARRKAQAAARAGTGPDTAVADGRDTDPDAGRADAGDGGTDDHNRKDT